MSIALISSPLQGYTDFRFRNAFQRYFGGIDAYYAPYIRLNGKHKIKPKYERDILPENNAGINLIPQLMCKDAEEFLFAAQYIQELGYDELNWNLGCPYPMVAKRGMGSGLIQYPELINRILDKVFSSSNISVSIKMRLGYEHKEEIFDVLPILEKLPIKNIAIHPRMGKQMYTGDVDLDKFQKCFDYTKHKVIYNGDITSVDSFNNLSERFPGIDHWMIGRGLIADPFLPRMIKGNTSEYPENRIETFKKFHDTLFHEYEQALSGPSHLLLKMYHLWEYFIHLFPDSHKGLKRIKKAKSLKTYDEVVKSILVKG